MSHYNLVHKFPDATSDENSEESPLCHIDGHMSRPRMRSWLRDCSNILKRNVKIFRYVFHDLNGPNHGQTLKISEYFLNEISMLIH